MSIRSVQTCDICGQEMVDEIAGLRNARQKAAILIRCRMIDKHGRVSTEVNERLIDACDACLFDFNSVLSALIEKKKTK